MAQPPERDEFLTVPIEPQQTMADLERAAEAGVSFGDFNENPDSEQLLIVETASGRIVMKRVRAGGPDSMLWQVLKSEDDAVPEEVITLQGMTMGGGTRKGEMGPNARLAFEVNWFKRYKLGPGGGGDYIDEHRAQALEGHGIAKINPDGTVDVRITTAEPSATDFVSHAFLLETLEDGEVGRKLF